MSRIVAPDKGVKETEVGRSVYRANKQGIYEVNNPAHIRAMKAEGFFEAALNPYNTNDKNLGFTCIECGFGSWFKKCGRCGHDNGSEIKTDGD
jgi:hypothetical protein